MWHPESDRWWSRFKMKGLESGRFASISTFPYATPAGKTTWVKVTTPLENSHVAWEIVVWRLLSVCDGPFLGDMLGFGGCISPFSPPSQALCQTFSASHPLCESPSDQAIDVRSAPWRRSLACRDAWWPPGPRENFQCALEWSLFEIPVIQGLSI